MKSETGQRRYQMRARAESAAATADAIVRAAILHFGDRAYDEVSLSDIAASAQVTVQTVLRRFGSKEGLIAEAISVATEDVRRDRFASASGDVEAGIHGLCRHYELWGDRSLRFLAQEHRIDAMSQVTRAGRALHAEWVEHVFTPWLTQRRGAPRERLRAKLIATTDVYVWKIFRRDLGMDEATTEVTIRELVRSVLSN